MESYVHGSHLLKRWHSGHRGQGGATIVRAKGVASLTSSSGGWIVYSILRTGLPSCNGRMKSVVERDDLFSLCYILILLHLTVVCEDNAKEITFELACTADNVFVECLVFYMLNLWSDVMVYY